MITDPFHSVKLICNKLCLKATVFITFHVIFKITSYLIFPDLALNVQKFLDFLRKFLQFSDRKNIFSFARFSSSSGNPEKLYRGTNLRHW